MILNNPILTAILKAVLKQYYNLLFLKRKLKIGSNVTLLNFEPGKNVILKKGVSIQNTFIDSFSYVSNNTK